MRDRPITLTDGVVTLRAWAPGDAPAVFAACQDPEIQRFLPVPRPYTEAVARHRRAEHRVELGYWLAPGARGNGYATRALRLISDWSLGGGYIRLELYTHPDNRASARVAERAGFIREGVRRAWDVGRDGAPEDAVFYVRIGGANAARPGGDG